MQNQLDLQMMKNRGNRVFYIADTHFYHKNIIKYCNRPFETHERMNEYMIDRWNAMVTNDDVVIHLGDFALCNFYAAQEILNQLNGYKVLVRGNHDGTIKYMRNMGWNEVVDFIDEDEIFIIHDPNKLTLHTLPIGQFTHRERYDNCKYFLHGHTHNRVGPTLLTKAINCCVELHDYTPKTLDQLVLNEIKKL